MKKKIQKQRSIKPGLKLQAVRFNGRVELIPVKTAREMLGFLNGINTDFEWETDRF